MDIEIRELVEKALTALHDETVPTSMSMTVASGYLNRILAVYDERAEAMYEQDELATVFDEHIHDDVPVVPVERIDLPSGL